MVTTQPPDVSLSAVNRVREQGAGALLVVAGDIPTAVAEYPDNVEPNTQISKASAPFFQRAF